MAELLCVKDLTKVYGKRGAVTRALDGVDPVSYTHLTLPTIA